MGKKEKSKGSNAPAAEKSNLSAKADVKSVIAKSSSKRKGSGRQLFGFTADQPAILIGFVALLFGIYFYYQGSIQRLFVSKSPLTDSNIAHVNNTKILGSVETQEQV